ncbi:hypothetical protein IW261DRAFT_318914 [Armillaria novae-zelandiae]|uniref:VASt domain-containing protein n=1 Tax=Armillaria novae-zelandiae TaxID=153914 RepID=A0AA39U395_9AGAR|nr:hypothetical protein IW261DRAFT_318914 [Armillaria novae-zelandiae]
MAPNFFSKLVKSPTSTHSRDRSFDSHHSPSPAPRSRTSSAISSTASPSGSTLSHSSPAKKQTASRINTSQPNGSLQDVNPSVMVVPPSPSSTTTGDARREKETGIANGSNGMDGSESTANNSARRRTPSSPSKLPSALPVPPAVADPATSSSKTAPASQSRPPSRPNTASSSKSSLREAFAAAFTKDTTSTTPPLPAGGTLAAPVTPEMHRKSSNKSLRNIPPVPPISTAHSRAATTPNLSRGDNPTGQNADNTSKPAIVESPTSITMPEIPAGSRENVGPLVTNGKTFLAASRDSDATSVNSVITPQNTQNQKKPASRPWKRPSSKPTGLASAIAASGLAMANPVLSAPQQVQLSPPAQRKPSLPSPPYLNRTGSTASHSRAGSTDFSPKSKRSSTASPRRKSMSVHSDINSEYPDDQAAGGPDYYSGLEDETSDEDEGDSDEMDPLMDLDLGSSDIPVTGFAVASSRRNADFHELFSAIPEGDYLIEDYGCALQREILIQGRLYISENHICFHANIFGWITDLSIPIYEIIALEKKMTAFVIPNAIQITTRQAKYNFASFLSRDTTFDVIYNIWRLARPEDTQSLGSGSVEQAVDQIIEGTIIGGGVNGDAVIVGQQVGTVKKKVTQCQCGKDGTHYSEKALEMIIPGTPERIYNLMFASGFMKEFLVVNQKLIDIQVSDWAPIEPGSKLLGRNMSYIKPLNNSVGPKQTKCEIHDETEHCDFDDYVVTVTTTRTPDVPSGGVFSVKTRNCIMWASAMSTKVIVTTQVEWTGRSFIKGIIERSAIDGQKVYHADLEKAMRAYISEHQSEFVPEGVDPAALALVEPVTAADVKQPTLEPTSEEGRKQRERERNRRGLQWAWDTFEGAASVAKQSTKGALELIGDAWDQSSSTTILIFVIVLLVISNIWTLARMGYKAESGKRKVLQTTEEREKWIHGVVTALWDELSAGKGAVVAVTDGHFDPTKLGDEIISMTRKLDDMEERIRHIKENLHGLVTDVTDAGAETLD